MASIVKLHHNIIVPGCGSNSASASNAGVLSKPGVVWGNNALQTITIARHTPFNPQQAVGYKGIVDYTSSPVTSDLTLDCILTEQSEKAKKDSSVYNYADCEVIVGEESYVLTSCNINFQAGNPATVNYGYITAGLASELISSADPSVLSAGEEAAFAVVMGEDGKGVTVVALDKNGNTFPIPPGAQTIGFTASMNRNQILDVRSSSPVQFVTTYPLDLSVNLELLQKIVGKNLGSIAIETGASTTANGIKTTAAGNRGASTGVTGNNGSTGTYVKATGLMLTEDGESVNVGGNLTYTYNFTAADIWLPLPEITDGSNSASVSGQD
jgi:hypothetical protein